jgi:uncharacterized protein (DUF1501 family)
MNHLNRNLQRWSSIASLKALLPAWMPRLAFAPQGQAPRGNVLIVIFQRGGMDGLSALIPVGDANYYQLRRKLAIAEPKGKNAQSAIDLDGYFALHPALAPLKPIYDAGMLAPIHAVGSPDASHSHFDAMDIVERGAPSAKALGTGWLGRHLASMNPGNDSPLRAVGMGSILQAALRGPVSVMALQSIAEFHLKGRSVELPAIQRTLLSLYVGGVAADAANPAKDESMAAQRRAMRELDATLTLLSKLDATHYQPSGGAVYPDTDFGLGLMQVAQLIKAEVGLEVACLDIGGWDTHAHQGGATGELAELLTELAAGMAALFADLGDVMQQVTLLTMSEFGRRAQENGSGGTDHGHANAMFLMGGNVVGRKVHGDWPTLAQDKLSGPGDLAMTTDYRDVLSEVLHKSMGNANLGAVFPDFVPQYRGVIAL